MHLLSHLFFYTSITGTKLNPFVDSAEHQTEDVVSVFRAADNFEQYILGLIKSVFEGNNVEIHFRKAKLIPNRICFWKYSDAMD